MMRLDESLFEAIDNMSKDEYLRDAAKISWESGHSFDPDDFSYFKKVCKEDGYNVNEEDFQKYWEYFDECRANQFADEDNDTGVDLGDWEEMESKQVEDSDGFMTDYTWYVKDNDDGSETHVMIFGDKDLYTPMNSEPDAEFDGEDVAREWFDNYRGFAEDDLDEALNLNNAASDDLKFFAKDIHDYFGGKYDIDIVDGYKIHIKDVTKDLTKEVEQSKYVKANNLEADTQRMKDGSYVYMLKKKEAKQVKESFDSDEIYNGYVVRKSDTSDNYFVYDNNGHVEDDEHKGQGYPTKEAAIERANSLEKGIAKSNSDLEEAIKPNIESEELKALAQKHNIKILDAMNNGDLRMEGAGADLMKFYQEAEKLGLWQVSPELYEALHGPKEISDFLKLCKEIGLETFGDLKRFADDNKNRLIVNKALSKLGLTSSSDAFFETLKDYRAELLPKNFKIKDSEEDNFTYDDPLHVMKKRDLDESINDIENVLAKNLSDKKIILSDAELTDVANKMQTLGISSEQDIIEFLDKELQEGQSVIDVLKAYEKEISDLDLVESKLDEIAVLNIDKTAIFDAIANAKAYISENKFPQAQDALKSAIDLLDIPINEGAISNLDLEIREAGSEQNWKDLANKQLAEMKDSLHYLRTYAPKEVGAGGNYDSAADLQADIDDLEKAVDELQTKIDYINSIKRIR